jgi:hypothetical protein
VKGITFGEFGMDKCITCADKLSSEDIGWCNRCAQFAPLLVGAGFEGRPSLAARQSINAVLSPNRRRTAHPRWRAILEEFDNGESDWAFSPTQEILDGNDPWFVTDEKRERQLKKLRNSLCIPNRDDDDGEKMLQKGIPLPDGSHLSMISDIWAIDGRTLPGSVPINHLLRALTGNSKERERFENCDWKSLLATLLIVANRRVDGHNVRGNYQNRQMNRMQRILLRREHPPGRALFEGADLFLRWNAGMNRLAARAFGDPMVYGVVGGYHRENEIRGIEEGWSDIDWDLLQSNNQLWVKRWREVMAGGTPLATMRKWAGPSLRIHQGKLQIRTIKSGKWIWSQIPPWPRLWALLTSWALSPPSSDEHQHLRALQWCWHENEGELMPAEPECRALLLLRGICESDKRITVSTEGEFHVKIEGTSGLFYAVGPGPGAHGARFTVTGAESLENLEKGRCMPICIHEDGNFKQLPVGDVIASVILTLMDDLTSAQKLEPLAKFISDNGLREARLREEPDRDDRIQPHLDDPRWLEIQRRDYRFDRGRHRGRWLNIFPAVFRVMINTPIGDIMRIPRETPNAVTIDGTMVAWVVRDVDELDLVRGLARLTGFRRREDHQGGDFEVFERVHAPVQGVRRELVEMLGPYERRHGRAGEPPWWNLFPNPIAPNQLLDRLPNRLNIPIEDGIGYHH